MLIFTIEVEPPRNEDNPEEMKAKRRGRSKGRERKVKQERRRGEGRGERRRQGETSERNEGEDRGKISLSPRNYLRFKLAYLGDFSIT